MEERVRFTIDELAVKAAEALSRASWEQQSGRVRDIPDRRTIRYYTTLGILDKPLEFQGRTALYGPRHLLQLIAIKKLQAQGLSLLAVQKRLLGLSDAALREICALPEKEPLSSPSLYDSVVSRRRSSFWKLSQEEGGQKEKQEGKTWQGISLEENVILLLGSLSREISEVDREAIQAAAAPLLRLLKLRHLISSAHPQKGKERTDGRDTDVDGRE